MKANRINVVVGIIYNNTKDSIFLCMRPPGVSQQGLWEFPGGKLLTDETLFNALRRELYEEVGIHVEAAHPLVQFDHDYPDVSIRLHAWIVDHWSGKPCGLEDQITEWVPIADIANRQFPEANARILRSVRLPTLYLVTPDLELYDDSFLQLTETMIASGLGLFQFRSKCTGFDQHKSLVRELVQMCNRGACRLIYNGTAEQAIAVGAHGVHLPSQDLMQLRARPLPEDSLVAASCHDRQEIVQAASIGVDFCVIAPVHQTSTHPGSHGLGWRRFSHLAGMADMPVYALGGIKPDELPSAHNSGAHGIAMISGVWDAPDPVGLIAGLNHI